MLRREEVERIKEQYPKGTLIRLYSMEGEQTVCYPAPLVLQIILISVKLNEGTDSDILMFFTAECLNRYLLVLSYQSYKNSRYLPDQSLTPAIITIRCTTTSLNREMLHQRYDNNYSTF